MALSALGAVEAPLPRLEVPQYQEVREAHLCLAEEEVLPYPAVEVGRLQAVEEVGRPVVAGERPCQVVEVVHQEEEAIPRVVAEATLLPLEAVVPYHLVAVAVDQLHRAEEAGHLPVAAASHQAAVVASLPGAKAVRQ